MTQRPLSPQRGTAYENLDSIGFGKLGEKQMKAIVDLVKERGLIKRQPGPEYTPGTRGIVICAGGRYADWGFVNARWLRNQGFQDPIQIWHFPGEYPEKQRVAFKKLDVEFVDAGEVRKKHWHRKLEGWTLKQYAAAYAKFEDICSLDADCFLRKDPKFIWDDPDYREVGALFFPDIKDCRANNWAYTFASVPLPKNEMDSGVFFWNRPKAWEGIKFTNWIGEHSEVWDNFLWGDKDRPYLGFGTTGTPFMMAPECRWMGWGIRQGFREIVIADHAMAYKRGEHNSPHPVIPGFFEEFRSFVG